MSHIQQITLDLIPNGEMPILYASRYDAGRSFRANIVERKIPYTLDGTELISLTVRKGDGNLVTMDIANTFADKSYIDFLSTEQMTAVSGSNFGELHLESNGESIGTLNFYLLVEPAADEGGITSQSEINNLKRQVHDAVVEELEDNGASETGYDNSESGLTATNVQDAIDEVNTKIENIPSVDAYTKEQSDQKFATKTSLATVATSGNYNDLSNKPTIPAAQVNSDWNADSGISQILNKPSLSKVATTGDYNDLNNKPSVAVIDDTTASASKVYSSNKVETIANTKANNDLSNISDGVITQPKLSFAELKQDGNLFNVADSDMYKKGYWYNSYVIGTVMTPKQNQYTTGYIAVKVPTNGATKVTFGFYPTADSMRTYWVGAVDSDMKLLAYSEPNTYDAVTFNLPTGTAYFLASPTGTASRHDEYLSKMVCVEGDTITKYVPYEEPYYFLNGCKCLAPEPTAIATMQTIIGTTENDVKICAPDEYDLVVGDTFELFYKGIISAVKPELFDIYVTCSKGKAFNKKYVITPDTAENLTLKVYVYGINHNLLDKKTITLKVHAKATSPNTQKNVLCVGDSLTQGGKWVGELARRLTASGGTPEGDNLSNINFIGTCEADGVHYEGYGGFTFGAYNTEHVSNVAKIITCSHDKTEADDQHSIYRDANYNTWKLETINNDNIKIIFVSGNASNFPSTGTLTWVSGGVNHSNIVYTASENASGNPFWDSNENKVDFGTYATRLGVSSIDYVVVLLGWNNQSSSESGYKNSVQTFINNVKASFPNAKIVLLGLEIPAKEGLANNYGSGSSYAYYYDTMQFVFTIDKWYDDIVGDNTNVTHINIAGQFDTENNMLTATMQVNTRNTTLETYQSNGIHPATSGYLQIADAVYRHITKLLGEGE